MECKRLGCLSITAVALPPPDEESRDGHVTPDPACLGRILVLPKLSSVPRPNRGSHGDRVRVRFSCRHLGLLPHFQLKDGQLKDVGLFLSA